jgi:hypothetical protein
MWDVGRHGAWSMEHGAWGIGKIADFRLKIVD